MIRDSAFGGVDRVCFGGNISRGGTRVTSPIIQKFRHMHNLPRFVRQPENHVVILRAVKLAAVELFPFEQLPVKTGQMTDIIVRPEIVDRVVRLEMNRHKVIQVRFPERRFVAVQIIGALFVDDLRVLVQNRRVQIVVMVKRRDVISLRKRETLICIVGYTAVFIELLICNPLREVFTAASVFGDNLSDISVSIVRTVREAELPVVIGLV